MPTRDLKLPIQRGGRYTRIAPKLVTRADDPEDAPKLFEIAVSSEYPVKRWWGTEVLAHEAEAVNLERFNNRAAVLVDHGGDQVGVIERAWLAEDRVLRAEIRFSRSQRGREIEQDVEDGIRSHISVGYRIDEAELVAERDGVEEWRVVRWTPHEASIVSVPADPTVGVGRAESGAEYPVRIISTARSAEETRAMPPETNTPAAPAAPAAPAVAIVSDPAADAREIVQLCADAGEPALAARFLSEGKSPKAVAVELFRMKANAARPVSQPAAEVMDAKSRKRYSYARAILSATLQREGQGKFDGLEAEVSQELERTLPLSYKRQSGIFVPMQIATDEELAERRATRALQANQPGRGTELVGQEYGELIEILRARVVSAQLGATFLTGLTSPITWPAQTGAMTAQWLGEAPAAPGVPQTDPTIGFKVLSPKTLMASNQFSRQLLVMSRFDVEQMVRSEIAAVHARALDTAAFHGLGAGGQPAGLYVTPDVNVVAFGGVPAFGRLVDMVSAIAADNADVTSMGFVTTPLAAGRMMQTLEFAAAGARAIWTGTITDGQVAGYRAIATNSISSTLGGGAEHGIVAGNFGDLIIGTWGAMELVVDPYTNARQGLINVTSFEMADVMARRGESFSRGTGMTIV